MKLTSKFYKRYILMSSCSRLPFPNKTRNLSLLPLWIVSARQGPVPGPAQSIQTGPGTSLCSLFDCLCRAGLTPWSGNSPIHRTIL